jgi:hypothetical protein
MVPFHGFSATPFRGFFRTRLSGVRAEWLHRTLPTQPGAKAVPSASKARQTPRCTRPLPKASPRGRTSWLKPIDPACGDTGAQEVPPARATVRPSLRESSSRVSSLLACYAPGPPASAAQVKAPKKTTRQKLPAAKLRSWRVSIIRKRGQYLGTVEAPNVKAAEAAAVAEFGLSDEQRRRLVVQVHKPNLRSAGP